MQKHLTKIIIFIGFLIAVLGLILDPIVIAESNAEAAAMVATIVGLVTLSALLSLCFIFSGNKIILNVGYGLSALVGAYGIPYILFVNISVACIGYIIMLLGAIIYAIFVMVNFFGYVKNGGVGDAVNADISVLNSYKDMQADGILSEEEFDSLKSKVLGSAKSNTLTDLKKWKKLLEQNVITEEEFIAIKTKILNAQ